MTPENNEECYHSYPYIISRLISAPCVFVTSSNHFWPPATNLHASDPCMCCEFARQWPYFTYAHGRMAPKYSVEYASQVQNKAFRVPLLEYTFNDNTKIVMKIENATTTATRIIIIIFPAIFFYISINW